MPTSGPITNSIDILQPDCKKKTSLIKDMKHKAKFKKKNPISEQTSIKIERIFSHLLINHL